MSAAAQLDIIEAIRQREAGMDRVLLSADEAYREDYMQAIATLARRGVEFTADDCRAIAGDPPESCSPNLSGALFNAAAKAGLIEAVGYARSGRVIGHGNRLLSWRGKP